MSCTAAAAAAQIGVLALWRERATVLYCDYAQASVSLAIEVVLVSALGRRRDGSLCE